LDQGTAAQLRAVRKSWEEDILTYRTFNTVQQALKKQIITVFEPMYLEILNDKMVGFSTITAQEMIDHLYLTYGSITTIELENNFEQMRKAWDPRQPVETLIKQIQDCDDFLEPRGVSIGHPQQINVGYTNIFSTGSFMSACRRWNEKDSANKTWTNFKVHFAVAHRQNKKMQGGSASNSGYHATHASVGKTEYLISDAPIDTLTNMATATATDRDGQTL
jgi:hypothetical protein